MFRNIEISEGSKNPKSSKMARSWDFQGREPGAGIHMIFWSLYCRNLISLGHLRSRNRKFQNFSPPFRVRPAGRESNCGISDFLTENVPNWPRTGAGAAVRESELILKSVFHNGDLDIVEILVEQGTDLKLKDEDGVTILEYAMEEGHKDIVRQRILKMWFRT